MHKNEPTTKQRTEHKGPMPTNKVDDMIVECGFSHYFWSWDTIFKRDVPLLQVYIGVIIDERHEKFRAAMLKQNVRVKFINHSHITR